MTGTEQIQQPRKRLFILLLAVGGALVLGLAFLLWWVPSVGLENIHPVLPVVFGVVLSILAIIPPWHATGRTNLFYFRSFAELEEEEFIAQFMEAIVDKEKLYDAYLHEIYYLGKYRLTRKYALVRNGLWILLLGLLSATGSELFRRLVV